MAETTESPKENDIDAATAMTRHDFEPAMGQDVDDEATIEEEEILEAGEGFNRDELDDLQKDAEVPIEDLLALYYNPGQERCDEEDASHVPLDDIQPEPLPPYDHTEEMDENGVDISPRQIVVPEDSPQSHPASPSQSTNGNPPENQRITRGLAAAYQYFPETDSSSSDEDYSPAEDWKKEIQVGPDHQADVPETTCPGGDEDREHSSKCLWSPRGVSEHKLQKYIDSVCGSSWDSGSSCVMSKGDDEQALYVLLQCNYQCEEAVKKFKSQPPPSEEMTFWSEEECRNFELGLRTYGKDFYSIQQAKIPGRTVGDIVQFYYLWKKTERHDAFSWQLRSKKKCSFHPGITEYMDRFLDENESAASSRAGSPGRPHTVQPSVGSDDSNVSAVANRPSATDAHNTNSSSSIISSPIRVPQAYVPTPVIVSNDKEPPAKKPNLGNTDSFMLSNGPPPLKSLTTSQAYTQIPHVTNEMSGHVTANHETTHGPSHMVSHMISVPPQLATGIISTAAATSIPNNGRTFSSLNTGPQHHLNIHNIESGNTYARLTQNS